MEVGLGVTPCDSRFLDVGPLWSSHHVDSCSEACVGCCPQSGLQPPGLLFSRIAASRINLCLFYSREDVLKQLGALWKFVLAFRYAFSGWISTSHNAEYSMPGGALTHSKLIGSPVTSSDIPLVCACWEVRKNGWQLYWIYSGVLISIVACLVIKSMGLN